jgi:HSP20 family protein
MNLGVKRNLRIASGKKESKVEEKKANYYLLESAYGSFSRSLRLSGDIDEGEVEANFQNGVLKLTMPQKKTTETKQIKIEG